MLIQPNEQSEFCVIHVIYKINPVMFMLSVVFCVCENLTKTISVFSQYFEAANV